MQLALSSLILAIPLAWVAGMVRGYSGFGFAMLLVLGLMGMMPPLEAIAVALLLDLVGSASLWRWAWHQAERRLVGHLVVGMLIATLVGVWLATHIAADRLRLVIATITLLGAIAIAWQRPAPPRSSEGHLHWSGTLAGGISGLCMTLASAGGPPLMLYLLQTRLPAVAVRATAILFFAASTACSLIGLAPVGALSGQAVIWSAYLIVPAWIGNSVGQWAFRRWRPESLKSVVVPLLGGLSLWVLVGEWLA
ncbi:sulfite exporter TauE/SafE family protein [Halomonas sp. BBD48]|nr:sulfite exporter TauE/SafE family protein [Halomonas sp. BBD48]